MSYQPQFPTSVPPRVFIPSTPAEETVKSNNQSFQDARVISNSTQGFDGMNQSYYYNPSCMYYSSPFPQTPIGNPYCLYPSSQMGRSVNYYSPVVGSIPPTQQPVLLSSSGGSEYISAYNSNQTSKSTMSYVSNPAPAQVSYNDVSYNLPVKSTVKPPMPTVLQAYPYDGSSLSYHPYNMPVPQQSIKRQHADLPNSLTSLPPQSVFDKRIHSNASVESQIIQLLCSLGKSAPKAQPSSSPTMESSHSDSNNSPVESQGKSYGHVICPHCCKINQLRSPTPPDTLLCFACRKSFPVVRRFLHAFHGAQDSSDRSLELPCLRGVTDKEEREKRLDGYLQTALAGRRCPFSSQLRDAQRILCSLVSKVDKLVTREKKHMEEECLMLVDNLLTRVEQYSRGELHCCCLQPAHPQRHFIQCDHCDLWFHTSCVGMDSRKLASVSSFICPWCAPSLPMKTTEEVPEEEETSCACPLCNRVFPRPCNLSRHLHAKHNMKWSTHLVLHTFVDDYLEIDVKGRPKNPADLSLLCDGCYATQAGLKEYEMSKSHYRFLLRKLRTKPSQWWVGRDVRVWDADREEMRLGTIKGIRPRNEFMVRMRDGTVITLNNLFDPMRRVRLLILSGNFELELYHVFPVPHIRSIESDLQFVGRSSGRLSSL